MRCNICGIEIKENQNFCPNCGSTVELQDANVGEENNISNETIINVKIDPVIIKAREVYKHGKFYEAKKLFDEALMNNPNSIEASFFSPLSSLQMAFKAKNIDNMMLANEMIKTSIENIKNKYVETDPMNEYVFSTCFDELFNLFGFGKKRVEFMKNMGNFIHEEIVDKDRIKWTHYYFYPGNYEEKTIMDIRKKFIETIYKIDKENHKLYFTKILVKGFSFGFPHETLNDKTYLELYNTAVKIVSEKDAKFISDNNLTPPQSFKTGGCYIATAVYGSYDCPEVWVLRRFRDNELSTTMLGRLFITLYYAVSPTFIKIFGHTKIFNYFGRSMLDSWVNKLKERGYEDTCYYD